MDTKELERRYGKGIAAHQAGRLAEAETIYAQILKAVPGADAVLTNMAALQYAKGNHQQALGFADRALKTNPLNTDALANRATILLALDRTDEARSAFEQLIAVDDRAPLPHYNLGNLYYQLGDLAMAEAQFRKALALAPDLHQAAFNLGNVLVELGRLAEARSCYEKALLVQPAHPGGQLNLANLLAEMGEIDQALLQLGIGLEILPRDAALWSLKSRLKLERGEEVEAFEAADQAVALDPGHPDPHIHLGNALAALDREHEAEEAYRKALAVAPDHPGATRNLRRLLSNMVPAWHFPMLADDARNRAFEQAIANAVRPGDTVLDIGTGSGLLAMMAARAGASKVYACEANHSVATVAKDIVRKNGYADRVEVMSLHSGRLKVGKQMHAPADVIVTEILDAALLGEGVLPSMRHALRHLAHPGARVVPAAAQVVAQLLYLPDRITREALGDVCGFDLTDFDQFRMEGEYKVINLEERQDYAYSEVVPLKYFDFANVGPMVSEERPEQWEQAFRATRTGLVNGIGLWFELHLDADIRLTSGPGGQLKHWWQAVFLASDTRQVQEGQDLTVQCSFSDMMWFFDW